MVDAAGVRETVLAERAVDVGRLARVPRSVGERLWILIVAGVPTGVLVAGVGSRLAMYVLRLTSPDGVRGLTSDDGFEIGRFTLGGTHNLLALGAAVGVVGAAAYQSVAPWLLGPRWFRRFTVAAASGAVVGSMLVHADGIDFRVLKPLWLAIGLFVALPTVFGLSIAAAVDRVAQRGLPRGRQRWVVPALFVLPFPQVLPLLVVVAAVAAAWVLVRPTAVSPDQVPVALGLAIRAGWLTVAVVGLVALIGDVRALT